MKAIRQVVATAVLAVVFANAELKPIAAPKPDPIGAAQRWQRSALLFLVSWFPWFGRIASVYEFAVIDR